MNDESQLDPKGTTRLHAQDGLVIRPQETQVPDGDPWSDDRLDRSGTAEELTRLLKNEHSISVSLSGGWGDRQDLPAPEVGKGPPKPRGQSRLR